MKQSNIWSKVNSAANKTFYSLFLINFFILTAVELARQQNRNFGDDLISTLEAARKENNISQNPDDIDSQQTQQTIATTLMESQIQTDHVNRNREGPQGSVQSSELLGNSRIFGAPAVQSQSMTLEHTEIAVITTTTVNSTTSITSETSAPYENVVNTHTTHTHIIKRVNYQKFTDVTPK